MNMNYQDQVWEKLSISECENRPAIAFVRDPRLTIRYMMILLSYFRHEKQVKVKRSIVVEAARAKEKSGDKNCWESASSTIPLLLRRHGRI